jgi:hypothetical protein
VAPADRGGHRGPDHDPTTEHVFDEVAGSTSRQSTCSSSPNSCSNSTGTARPQLAEKRCHDRLTALMIVKQLTNSAYRARETPRRHDTVIRRLSSCRPSTMIVQPGTMNPSSLRSWRMFSIQQGAKRADKLAF